LMLAIAMLWRIHAAHCCADNIMPLLVENLPGYLDIFACGMLCAWTFARYGHHLRTPRISLGMPILAIGGVVLCSYLLIGIFHQRAVPQWETALQIYTRPLYGIGFAAIALGSLTAPRLWQVLLANPPLRFLAFISYNLYLYHQMVARQMVWWHLPPYATKDTHGDPVWQVQYMLLAFVVTIVQATIVTYLFERPLLRLPQPRLLSAQRGHSP
jgi:peptidoglycan/LPS O-acetylase OafA/YrhL